MSKKKNKTWVMLVIDEDLERRIYKYCDIYGVKDKNIETFTYPCGVIFIKIRCSKKIFKKIRFKTNLKYW